ncbi:MAG: ABC transporter permease [Muribaculaceae bacterium]|nr:ABC transporter permease [Muribaculaceae bacterium]
MEKKRDSKILGWLHSIVLSMKQEFKHIFRDEAVVIFFVVLAVVYPPLYSLIYNPEVARDEAVVVVDDSHSALSRQFARDLNASPDVNVVGYAHDMEEARELMATKKCYGIVYFPADFETEVMSGNQGHVSLYCDMSVMMRYKAMLTALTNVQMETCSRLQGEKSFRIISLDGGMVESRQVPIGNTGMGIASAVLPFILVYVLQQGMLMGIAMLHAGSMGRRRRNRGIDPIDEVKATPGAMLMGKTLVHLFYYLFPAIFALHIIPIIFKFPMNGSFLEIAMLMFPFLIASSLFGQVMRVFVNNREGVFLILAFTSLIFVFLTGVSWPHYQIAPYWDAISRMIPAYWASTAYVQMQVAGASLSQMSEFYWALWSLVVVYFVLAYLMELLVLRPRYRAMQLESEIDPEAMQKRTLYLQGDDDMLNPELLEDEEEDE